MAILAIDLLDCSLLLILKDQLDELIVLVEKNIDRMSLMGGLLVLTNPYLRGTILGVVFDRRLVFVPLKALIGQLLLEVGFPLFVFVIHIVHLVLVHHQFLELLNVRASRRGYLTTVSIRIVHASFLTVLHPTFLVELSHHVLFPGYLLSLVLLRT